MLIFSFVPKKEQSRRSLGILSLQKLEFLFLYHGVAKYCYVVKFNCVVIFSYATKLMKSAALTTPCFTCHPREFQEQS